MPSKRTMKKWILLSIAAAAAVLAAGVASLHAGKDGSETGNLAKIHDGKLVVPDKGGGFEEFPIDSAKVPKYFAVYFSAHWCPPCRVFTPELVKFYDDAKARRDDFELIFVSSDTSEDAMRDYMIEAGMKFPALKYSERNTTGGITKYAGRGIPCLVVLDSNGKVLADTFRGEDYRGPQVALKALGELLKGDS